MRRYSSGLIQSSLLATTNYSFCWVQKNVSISLNSFYHIPFEAQSLGHHYIGTEHLLLGQLRQEESLAGLILRKSGVTLEKARELVKQLLAEEQTISPSNPEQHEQS